MAAMFGRKQPKFEFVQVAPGESGTPTDAFNSFTYWVPSVELQRRLLKQARDIGRHGQPDPTATTIPELDEIKEFRQLARQAAFNCSQAASQLFTKDREEISRLVSALSSRDDTDPNPAVTEQVRRARVQALSAKIVSLETALNRRLDTIGSHFDALRDKFMGGVYDVHGRETQLRERGWAIDGFHISDDMRDFGQGAARAAIAKISGE